MLLLVLHCILYLVASQCSLILDGSEESPRRQNNQKYCGQIGQCKPGEHVMCMYYRPGSTMGPKCTGAPIALKKEQRKHILYKINKMRAGIRQGNITANNVKLPKGYGLKDLEWDEELARFAQMWANQCSFGQGDLCRATDRFPNPGQFMGGIRYSYPNFEEAGIRKVLNKSKALTEQKASTIIETVLNTVYNTRFHVTKDMIFKHVGDGRSNLFLLVVYGESTHIGCAMSYWVSYKTDTRKIGHNLYSAALVCNLSAQPVAGEKVYETDSDVVLLSGLKQPSTTEKAELASISKAPTRRIGCNHNQNIEQPSMVLMPIIKIDESSLPDEQRKLTKPPTVQEKLVKVVATTVKSKRSTIVNRKFKITNGPKKRNLENKNVTKSKSTLKSSAKIQRRDRQINKGRKLDVKKRYFNRKVNNKINPGQRNLMSNSDPTKIPSSTKHTSIFTRVSKFELPSQHHSKNPVGITHSNEDSFKRRSNLSQRLSKKDLMRLEALVAEYFIKKQSRPQNSPVNVINPLINTLMQFLDTYSTINGVDPVNRNNQRLREMRVLNDIKDNGSDTNRRNYNDEIDEKLLNFMYNLVQASGVDFNEIVDATTRIIQGGKVSKEWSESSKIKLVEKDGHETPSKIATPVKIESDFASFVTRKQSPLVPYGKEIFGNIRNNYLKEKEFQSNKNKLGDVHDDEDFYALGKKDGHTRYLDENNINNYYTVDIGPKGVNYYQENIEKFQRLSRNRRNYRRPSYLNVNVVRQHL